MRDFDPLIAYQASNGLVPMQWQLPNYRGHHRALTSGSDVTWLLLKPGEGGKLVLCHKVSGMLPEWTLDAKGSKECSLSGRHETDIVDIQPDWQVATHILLMRSLGIQNLPCLNPFRLLQAIPLQRTRKTPARHHLRFRHLASQLHRTHAPTWKASVSQVWSHSTTETTSTATSTTPSVRASGHTSRTCRSHWRWKNTKLLHSRR